MFGIIILKMVSIIIYRGFGNNKIINEKKREKQKYDKEYYENKKIEKQKYDKEYYENNKVHKSVLNKDWRENNVEKVKDYNLNYYQNRKDYLLEKIECKCGATVCKASYNRHIKTRKHKKLVSTT